MSKMTLFGILYGNPHTILSIINIDNICRPTRTPGPQYVDQILTYPGHGTKVAKLAKLAKWPK